MILHSMIVSGERWRHIRKGGRMLIPCGRHVGGEVVLKYLSPSSGRIYCMSKVCIATAQLVLWKRFDVEAVSGMGKKNKEQRRKRVRQVMVE